MMALPLILCMRLYLRYLLILYRIFTPSSCFLLSSQASDSGATTTIEHEPVPRERCDSVCAHHVSLEVERKAKAVS